MTSKRCKVLFLFPFPSLGGGGGAQRVISTLLRRLDRDRFEPHLALLNAARSDFDEIPKGVCVHSLNYRRVRYSLYGLVRLIRSISPNVVFSNIGHMNIALLLCRNFLPSETRVLIGESTSVQAYLQETTRLPGLWAALYRRLYKHADIVICLSETMKKELATDFTLPVEKLVRIYNPLDVEMIRSMAAVGGNPFSTPGPHVVAGGRFVHEKGIDLLLNAMPQVLKRFPNARLTLLGEGPLHPQLEEQAKGMGIAASITFAGLQTNPWRYFLHGDVVVVPSRLDGMPYVALEALALAKPVVATDCPGAIREINESVATIVLVRPNDPHALAEGIVAALQKTGPPLSLPNLDNFDVQSTVKSYASVLERAGSNCAAS